MTRKPYEERSDTREQLMQMLYQMESQNNFSQKEKEKYVKSYLTKKSDKAYFEKMYNQVVNNKEDIDDKIKQFSKNWSFNRISKVDLSILRLAVAEILFEEKIPDSVAINEAVELAKRFGGKDSGKFINGMLGQIKKDNDKKDTE